MAEGPYYSSPEQLVVSVEPSDGCTRVVRVRGELDLVTAPRLAQLLRAQLAEGCAVLVVDLTGVEFLSSAGLNALAQAGRLATTTDARIVLIGGGNRNVRMPLEMSGLASLFPLHVDLDHALAAAIEPRGRQRRARTG
jgi:anti-anti-sigma factor